MILHYFFKKKILQVKLSHFFEVFGQTQKEEEKDQAFTRSSDIYFIFGFSISHISIWGVRWCLFVLDYPQTFHLQVSIYINFTNLLYSHLIYIQDLVINHAIKHMFDTTLFAFSTYNGF